MAFKNGFKQVADLRNWCNKMRQVSYEDFIYQHIVQDSTKACKASWPASPCL